MNTTPSSQVEIGITVKPLACSKFALFATALLSVYAELVLRRLDGSFYPTYWLLSTLCHEVRSEPSAFMIQDLTRKLSSARTYQGRTASFDTSFSAQPAEYETAHEPWTCVPSIVGTFEGRSSSIASTKLLW